MGLESKPVSELLSEVERGEIALPEIQREFVWKPHQIRDLIDTIYREYPAGLLLFWEKPYGEEIPYALVGGASVTTSGGYRSLVVDGQQRITSLLKVKRGEIKIYFNPVSEEFQLESSRIRADPLWFNVSDVMNMNKSLFDILNEEREKKLKEQGVSDQKRSEIIKRLERLRVCLNNYHFPVYKIPSNVTYEQITEIFTRINYKGTRIKTTDLVIAMFSVRAPAVFRKELRQLLSDLSDENWDLDASVLIRSLVGVAKGEGNLTNFRRTGMKITRNELMKGLQETREYIMQLIQIMKDLGIDSSDILPSGNVIPPIVTYLKRKNGKISDDEKKQIILWFLLSSFWGRYAGATDTRLGEDVKGALTGTLAPLFNNLRQQVGRLAIDKESFIERSYGNEFLLYLICYKQGALDWFKGYRIKTKFQKHHIFPRSLLEKTLKEEEYDLISHIANFAFLTEKANKTIRNSEPIKYLPNIPIERLKQQFVPLDKKLWKMKNYKKFLDVRTELIVEAINEWFKELGIKKFIGSI